jgi:hypothetical protein
MTIIDNDLGSVKRNLNQAVKLEIYEKINAMINRANDTTMGDGEYRTHIKTYLNVKEITLGIIHKEFKKLGVD